MSATDTPQLFTDREAGDGSPLGLIGDRQLTATQMFHIGRLTSHPIQLIPGTFVAVHGRGPRRDSNGSGKTTWLAAVSLLLGDPQWRLASGGTAAADLLFSPTAAGLRTKDYASTDHGYVVGVFTQPEKAPITVWLRINSNAPYLKIKWAEGVHLVGGESSAGTQRPTRSGRRSPPTRPRWARRPTRRRCTGTRRGVSHGCRSAGR